MGLGEFGAQHDVSGVLELVPLLELRLDPQPVECAPDEGRFYPHAEQAHSAAGLQPDLVEAGREHVARHATGFFAEALRPGQRGLAARGECSDAQAEFLHGRPRQRGADLRDQADDMTIGRGLVQRTQGGTQLVMSAGAKSCDGVVHPRRDRKFGQVKFEQ